MSTTTEEILETSFMAIIVIVVFLAFVGIYLGFFGWIVMLLWNALMPAIFGLTNISFWQSVGLMLLSGFLLKSTNWQEVIAKLKEGVK